MRQLAVLALLCVFGWVVAASAAPIGLPTGFTVPADFKEDLSKRNYWDFDTSQYDFLPDGAKNTTHQKVEGHLWHLAVSTTAFPLNNSDGLIAHLADEFQAGGWTILRRQGTFVAQKLGGAGDLWVSGTGNAGYFGLVLMQMASPSLSLALPAPKAEIETVKGTQDLPFALPLPGSKMEKTQLDHRSFEVSLPGSSQKLYAFSDETRWYDEPAGISSYEFATIYDKALAAAGWDVVQIKVGGDVAITAHFAQNGRDIWLYTHGDGGKQSINVVDNGAQSKESLLKQQLAKDGHIALYGIYFDTDSAVPLPASEPTLENVLKLLQDDGTLRLEVQGHTDNSGAPDHNQTLSEVRAASVVQWLAVHGIPADRLVAKGYGATMPVADNNTAEGKAKNRRVELANLSASAATAPSVTHAMTAAATNAKGTLLACTLGPQSGVNQSISIMNSTGTVLKPETIINVSVDATAALPGGADDCFAVDRALPANGKVSRVVALGAGATGSICRAYVSKLHPAVVHQADGGVFTECDPE
jgi:OOP family OmpA-OmpF porin